MDIARLRKTCKEMKAKGDPDHGRQAHTKIMGHTPMDTSATASTTMCMTIEPSKSNWRLRIQGGADTERKEVVLSVVNLKHVCIKLKMFPGLVTDNTMQI